MQIDVDRDSRAKSYGCLKKDPIGHVQSVKVELTEWMNEPCAGRLSVLSYMIDRCIAAE